MVRSVQPLCRPGYARFFKKLISLFGKLAQPEPQEALFCAQMAVLGQL